MRRCCRCRFQKKRSSACVITRISLRTKGKERQEETHRVPQRLFTRLLLLQPRCNVVPAVGKVERRRAEVTLDQPEEVRFFGLLEELSGRAPLDGEDAEVGGRVDGGGEDGGDLGALGDDD
jgi:hypothetical protein